MEEILAPLITQLGFGGLIGFVVGFAFKKLLKIFLVLVGLYFVTLQYLAYKGLISIHYDKFSEILQKLPETIQGGLTLPAFLTTNIPFLGSFIVGFGLGFKTG